MAYSLEQLEHIYEQCLNMPEEERIAFIAGACGNDHALEAMLLNMLKHQQQAIAYFDQMQQTLARGLADGDLQRLETGEKVGKYRITRFLAKGGMSNVYLAERNDGHFEQQVVVKCLPAKALNHGDALHQAEEHQILAKLRHPNIATLYDAGITSGNVPYFIMEFIEGIPIDAYVEQKNLSTDRRLALFEQVLQAVAYAHSHLILHLDLKPGNILVNEAGHVKLLDFGIATAITSPHQGQRGFVGTPKIAAPEQLSGEPLTVSTDVYQLGMLLHKLIIGKFPETEATPAPDEKSARERMQQAAENRKIDGNLDYELAAILKKCLHVFPANRYSGAGTLLDDVRNFRQHLPVGALEQKLSYRVAKFTQRHRTASIAFLLILLALIAGTTVSLWQAREARQQRDLALKNEQVSTATKNFLLDLFMAAHPSVNKGDTMTVFQFLDKGYEKAESYTGSPEIKLEMLTTIGKLYRSLGDYNTSKKVLAQVQAMAADSALSLSLTYVLAIQELALYQRDV
ncbi:MAG: serine/threonine-protein kinase, partial [Lentimicrobium sp.]|nr:serine/threonine-protein kinase [Lentimicrobium sp.]